MGAMDPKLAASIGLTFGLILGSTAGLLLRPTPPPPQPLPSRAPAPAPAPMASPTPLATAPAVDQGTINQLQDGLTDLLVQNRKLQASVAAEQRRLISAVEQQGKVTAEVAKSQMEIRRLRAKLLAAGLDPGGAPPADPTAAATSEISDSEPLTPWVIGGLPEGDAARLGLDEAQRMAVGALLKQEPARMGEAVREFLHREYPDLLTDDLQGKAPGQIIAGTLLPKLMPEMTKVRDAIQAANRAGVKAPGLWEVLDKQSASWKLAKALASARAATHEDLGRVLSKDQMHHVKRGFLPEHEFRFPGNLNLGFAPFESAAQGK
jgi:hypothetical protein